MEMHTCCLVSQLVGQVHSDLFTNVGPDCWYRPLIVDSYHRSFVQTIRIPVDPSDVPVVDSSRYIDAIGQGNEKGKSPEHHSRKSQ